MKFNIATLLCFICLQSHAAIIQQHVVVDAPVVSVRAGEQRNGNVAIEQLFTNNTKSAQEALSGSFVQRNSSPLFGGSAQRSAPAAFNALAELPVSPVNPPVDPITPAVPEPETYALMAIGLSSLLLSRRNRKNSNANQL